MIKKLELKIVLGRWPREKMSSKIRSLALDIFLRSWPRMLIA